MIADEARIGQGTVATRKVQPDASRSLQRVCASDLQ